ncbi:Protein of unknown function [Dyella jiangningensis]|uniref:DUF3828 domain-containing protein n=1 Tax=Dyella sp. AtDHG13 TaxID=1938897 RepID=UPI00088A801C|nr:DUF3828 domain-containing protein [Dyella sp. AtDHG13]PXV61560.1 uncharacterized protein DUF3828 [Dyella sp. AtDHG13]SDJ71448.1 Protein of unknown function [Dyella jiangningensis]
MKIPHSSFRLACVAAWLCVFALSTAHAAAPLNGVDPFIHRIYASYTLNGPGIPLSGEGAKPFLTPSLRQLVDRDQQLLHGEAGVLDADPLCACQDFDIRKLDGIAKRPDSTYGRTNVDVTFHNLGRVQTIELTLIKTGDGWRIDDIGYSGMPSIRQALTEEVEQLGHAQ